ncbi:hypothetical protein [Actinokineospora diospyrosa]|uniref:Secreted protein/lipoprotein n=1 Tax=Actinokineospora diospyrosa TaxID=103728 RepID=A0ABT1I5Q5_9PSEU|nr:hypothetical protein [Actinokineospora diospyrosa]MCP2267958.1 hypothetical protein [Actinokineospora diospyrosa]
MSPKTIAAVAMAVVVLTAGCGGPSADPPPTSAGLPTSSTPSTAVTTTTESADERDGRAASDAYLGMWRAMAQAGLTSDWQSVELAKYAKGEALSTITRSLYRDHTNQVVTKGEPKNNPQVTSVESNTVKIADCGDSTNWLKYKTTGELKDDTPGGRRAITAEATRQDDGSWRVTSFAVQAVGTC